jgi:DNA polymerase III alpha subunit
LRRDCEAFRLKHQKNSKFEALTEYLAENYYLGFSYSHTLKSIYSKHITGLINLKELKSSKAGKYRVVAQLSESENRVSKNKKPYIKYTLKDDSDTLICMNFNLDGADGKEYGLKMKDDSIACWHIEKKTREDGEIYFVSDIVEQEVPTVLKTSVVRKELEEKNKE